MAAKTDSKCYPTREMAFEPLFRAFTSEPLGAYAPQGNDVIIIRRCSALGIMIVSMLETAQAFNFIFPIRSAPLAHSPRGTGAL